MIRVLVLPLVGVAALLWFFWCYVAEFLDDIGGPGNDDGGPGGYA